MTQRRPLAERKVQARSDYTRQRVLEAAIAEFASRGMDGASTRRIATLAEVQQALVGYHFGSKQDLWRATLQAVIRGLVEPIELRAAGLKGVDPSTVLRLLLRDMLTWLLEHPLHYRLLLQAAGDAGDDYYELAASDLRPHVLRITALIGEAQENGQFISGDPCLLYYMLLGCAANRSQLEREHEIVCGEDAALSDFGTAHIDACLALFFGKEIPDPKRKRSAPAL